jgi:serine/threonine protein kinase/predicted ATPase
MFPGHEPVTPPPGEEWLALKDAIRRFENAWQQGPSRPVIDDYLPAGDRLRFGFLIELVHIDLEFRLKAGEDARVEEYLGRYPQLAADRSVVLQLIAAEHELRRRRESHLALDEYLARFPQYRHELPEHLTQSTVAGHDTPWHRADPNRQAPPEVAGYEILSPLGRGGMGVVYKARQQSLDRLVALKFLPEEYARDPVWLARFRREARTASALNHPHICTIYDTGECAGRPFLSMELIEGQTLESLIGQRLGVKDLAALFRQAARALAAAHAAGVVHRDIKPQNLMLRGDGILKVLDFGLARRLSTRGNQDSTPGGKATDPGTRVGTPLYMSPEQARAESVDSATDIFSLGIVLYELATGRHPFVTDSEVGVLHAIISQAPVPAARLNPEVSAPLEALMQQMLAKDPRLRPSAAEVEAALTELAADRRSRPENLPLDPTQQPMVGRERERAALRTGFESATAGRGLLLCVTGEPGLGKTTFVEEFLSELATSGRPHSLARGRCSERLAGAEAYLPLLEALDSLLHGDDGPETARLLMSVAPSWYVQVAPLAADDPSLARARAEAAGASQERRKRELGVFVRELSRLRPFVLFLDDIHWADPSSADLLAYLGGQCAELHILLVLTYRPSDLARSQQPFATAQLELQGRGICREIALPSLSRIDLDHYLQLAYPGHHFPEEFAAALQAKTGGNPLFMVHLLRYLRERKVIVQDQGRWVLTQAVPELQRELPESVRSMVQRKTDQLSEADRRLLKAASIQGLEFDSAVVAQMLNQEAADVEERLAILERVHALVRLLREHTFPDGTLTQRYAFVHGLYQNALYASLQPTRKAAWSAAAAHALLGHYRDQDKIAAGELALLFEAARDFLRAADYFRHAADSAVRVSAHREAIVLARRGLGLLQSLPPTAERAEKELPLQMILGLQLQVTQGYAASEAKSAYTRARELCDQVRDSPLLYPVLWGMFLYHKARSELSTALELAEELYRLAHERRDPALLLQSHQAYAVTTLCLGEPATTREHMEQAEILYDPRRHKSHTFMFGQDVGVACKAFGGMALWLLGYPDRAVQKVHEAVTLSHELAQPSSQVLALHFAAMLHQCRRQPRAALDYAEQSVAISAEHGFSFWHAGGLVLRGWALSECGSGAEGMAVLRQGLEAWLATGSATYETYYLALMAEILGKQGQREEELKFLEDALTLVEQTGERFFQAEIHRLHGVWLLRAAGDGPTRAETCFGQALAVARRQGAKSLELRAEMSLSRLYQRQGRLDEARRMLEESYGWFTEGLDTSDLREAQMLLEEISVERNRIRLS